MPATVTLSTTTLAAGIDASTSRIKVGSTSGLSHGTCLYVDGELMMVLRLEVDPWVYVRRGVGGSRASAHSAGLPIYIGRADQFYTGPPVGRPESAIPVSPYIDATNGRVYFAQGDSSSLSADRWWQEETTTHAVGPLGIRTTTLDPTSST